MFSESDEIAVTGPLLGEGSFAKIQKGLLKEKPVAIKINLKLKNNASFLQEIALHRTLEHPNIVRFLVAKRVSATQYHMALEFMNKGSLSDILDNPRIFLSDEKLAKIAQHTTRGIAYLHQLDILHRDIKLDNILVNEGPDGTWEIKIGDFGLSIKLEELEGDRIVGSPEYIALELMEARLNHSASYPYTKSTDIYALGILLSVLVCRESPFEAYTAPIQTIKDVLVFFQYALAGVKAEIPAAAPPKLASAIHACLARDPSRRPSAEVLLSSGGFFGEKDSEYALDLSSDSSESPSSPDSPYSPVFKHLGHG